MKGIPTHTKTAKLQPKWGAIPSRWIGRIETNTTLCWRNKLWKNMISITSGIGMRAKRLKKSKANRQRIKKLFTSKPLLKMMQTYPKMIKAICPKIAKMFKTTQSTPTRNLTKCHKSKANQYHIRTIFQLLQSNKKNQLTDTNCQKAMSSCNTPIPTLKSNHPSTRHQSAKAK